MPVPFLNDEKYENLLVESAKTLKDTQDIKYFSNSFKTEEEKVAFFENNGLKVEKLKIKDMGLTINQIENESEESKKRIYDFFGEFTCWKMILMDKEKNENEIE